MTAESKRTIVVYRCDCCDAKRDGDETHYPDGWIGYAWRGAPDHDTKGNGYDLCDYCYFHIKAKLQELRDKSKATR